jgi:hypothetical protein
VTIGIHSAEPHRIGLASRTPLACSSSPGPALGIRVRLVGNTAGRREARRAEGEAQAAVAAIAARADKHAASVLPIVREVQKAGARALREIADALNARGVPRARGGRWFPTSVSNVLPRASLRSGISHLKAKRRTSQSMGQAPQRS